MLDIAGAGHKVLDERAKHPCQLVKQVKPLADFHGLSPG